MGRKRVCARLSTPGGSERKQVPPLKKRAIAAKMVEKWKKEYDKELDTATWLRYEMEDRDHVLKYYILEDYPFSAWWEG